MRSILLLLIVLVLASSVWSCQKEYDSSTPQSTALDPNSLTTRLNGVFPGGIVFPEGTVLELEGSSLRWTLPEGFEAVGLASDGGWLATGGGTLTCTCVEGTEGCSPAKIGSSWFCMQPVGCKTCNSQVSPDEPARVFVNSPQFVQPEEFAFVHDMRELAGLRLAQRDLLIHEDFQKSVKRYLNQYATKSDEPLVQVLLKAWGTLVIAEVPQARVQPDMIRASNASCDCAGGSGCTLEKGSGIIWCQAGPCMSCSLTVSDEEEGGRQLRFDAQGYLLE